MPATLLLLTFCTALLAQPDRFGLPACTGPGQELAWRDGFVLCHDGRRKASLWTAYELTPQRLGGRAPRLSRFRRDPGLAGPSSSNADFHGSPFVRGIWYPPPISPGLPNSCAQASCSPTQSPSIPP
ncbi:MAG: hypothetical protein FJW39_26140 [Acidobacteria bacterium]|nr:hypothetical protein [Acidobacteriota bacterium]